MATARLAGRLADDVAVELGDDPRGREVVGGGGRPRAARRPRTGRRHDRVGHLATSRTVTRSFVWRSSSAAIFIAASATSRAESFVWRSRARAAAAA